MEIAINHVESTPSIKVMTMYRPAHHDNYFPAASDAWLNSWSPVLAVLTNLSALITAQFVDIRELLTQLVEYIVA